MDMTQPNLPQNELWLILRAAWQKVDRIFSLHRWACSDREHPDALAELEAHLSQKGERPARYSTDFITTMPEDGIYQSLDQVADLMHQLNQQTDSFMTAMPVTALHSLRINRAELTHELLCQLQEIAGMLNHHDLAGCLIDPIERSKEAKENLENQQPNGSLILERITQ